jgi:hypothetical protein
MPHHAHSIDRWDDATGSSLYEHLAGVNDLLLAAPPSPPPSHADPAPRSPCATVRAIIEKTWPTDD